MDSSSIEEVERVSFFLASWGLLRERRAFASEAAPVRLPCKESAARDKPKHRNDGCAVTLPGYASARILSAMVVHQPRDADNAVSRHTSPLNDPFEFINEGEGISFDLFAARKPRGIYCFPTGNFLKTSCLFLFANHIFRVFVGAQFQEDRLTQRSKRDNADIVRSSISSPRTGTDVGSLSFFLFVLSAETLCAKTKQRQPLSGRRARFVAIHLLASAEANRV